MKNRIPPKQDHLNLNRPSNALLVVDTLDFIIFYWRLANGRYMSEKYHATSYIRAGWSDTLERPEGMPHEIPQG